MRFIRHTLRVVFLVAALLVAAGSALGASISGTVSDADGTAVANAEILVQLPESNFSTAAVTREDGSYTLDALPRGNYTITVKKSGYQELVQQHVAVADPDETLRLNLRLQSNRAQTTVQAVEELNPNVFIVKLDTNEIKRNLDKRGAEVEFLPEFRAQENYYGAVSGYPLRRVEILRPRPPLKSLHGSVYELHQNSALNARSFFTAGKLQPSRRNEYGFTVGGPVIGQKVSFDFAWSQVRDSGNVNGNVLAPLANERTPRSSDPAVNAVIGGLLKAYPEQLPNLPSVSIRQLNANAVRDIRSTAFSSRLDYRLRESDLLAFEQRFFDSAEEPFQIVVGDNPVTFLRPQSFHVSEIHTFSPSTVARLSFNFDRLAVRLDATKQYRNLLSPLGIAVVPEVYFGQELTGLGPGGSYPRRRVENRFHVAPEVTHVAGKHTLSAGFRMTRLRINDLQSDNSRGEFSFDRNFGRSAVENFLLGTPTSFTIALGDFYRGFRNWENAFSVQDTFRASRRLTFSLGLRYEIITAPVEVNNLTAIAYSTDANNFAPQFGFAWNPGGGKTTLRGGYGIAFGSVFPILYQHARFNPPAVRIIKVDNPNLLDPLRGVDRSAAGQTRSELNLLSPDLVVPYTHVYNFGIERGLPGNLFFRIGYIGSRTFKITTRFVSNRAGVVPGIPITTATINLRRPDPRYLEIKTYSGGTNGYFDGVQLYVDKRMSRGLTWNARYTFSKAIYSGDTYEAQVDGGFHNSVNEDVVGDLKGLARFDTPHALTVGYRYELPWLRGKPGLASALLGGWKISGTSTFKSGTPTHAHTGSDSPGWGNVDGVGGDRPNLLNTAILWKSLDHPDRSPLIFRREYFDTNLPPGGRGNLGYETFRNDGINNWNLAVEKDFAVKDNSSLQFRAEFFNASNAPQFDEVAHTIATETFGKIINTANKGRVIQLGLRLRM